MSSSLQFHEWLNRAHQLELEQIPILEAHAKLAEALPDIRQSIERHRDETVGHRDAVASCLALLGQKPSPMRSAVATATGKAQGMASALYRDAILRDLVEDYAAESCEIAHYTCLIAAAKHLGHLGIAKTLQTILDDEVEMAVWIRETLPQLTTLMLETVDT